MEKEQKQIVANKALKKALVANMQNNARLRALDKAGGYGTEAGVRGMYKVFGYPDNPTIADFADAYDRQGLAFRAINAFPDGIWPDAPTIQDRGDSDTESPFETAFKDLAKRTKLFHFMNRLDKLVCLGHYAVLLIGVSGSDDFKTELTGVTKPEDIMYLKPFSEANALIETYDEDVNSPRYGKPDTYKIKLGGYSNGLSKAATCKDLIVHHSRIVHCAWGTLENDIFGTPLLKPSFNRFIDKEKVLGGASNIFLQNGRSGLHLDADIDEGDIELTDAIKEGIDDFDDGLTRLLITQGMNAKTLDMKVYSPDKHMKVIVEDIAGSLGIPNRILNGSEMGQLASGQDKDNWNTRLAERRVNFCEPMMLRPFIDKMIEIAALPTPEGSEYEVVWSELVSQSAEEKAEVAFTLAKAMDNFTRAGANRIMTDEQYATEVLGVEYKKDEVAQADDEPDEPVVTIVDDI